MQTVQPIRNYQKIEKILYFLREENYRDYMIFYLGINTGLRISDLLKLKVYEVKNKDHIHLREQKTNKERYIKISANVKNELKEYTKDKNNNDFLFTARYTNYKISRVRAYQIIKKIGRQFKIDNIGTHTLRKTFGYWFYKQYKDLATLMVILNHRNQTETLKYIGMSQDLIDNRIDNFKLGEL